MSTDTLVPRSDEVYDRGLDFFSTIVEQVPAGAWDNPSPCEGWTALDVLGHLGGNIETGTKLLRGEQPEWPNRARPAEAVDGEPAAWWTRLVPETRAALAGADLDLEVDTPMGKRNVADRLAFPAIDLFVHGWDLAKAAGVEVEIPEDVIAFSHSYIDPFPTEMVRGEKGAFGPEAEVPADATPTEAFLAWTGRSPR
jgi:uncharacterized protein (TIGR03086 family)